MRSNVAEFVVRIEAEQMAEIDLTLWGNFMREQVGKRLEPIGHSVTSPDISIQLIGLSQRQVPWEQPM